jgi:hypothetical protein
MGGDFNMIKSLLEKKGGARSMDLENEAFGTLIENLRLIDIPTRSGLFTWNNERGNDKRITVRLDIFLVTKTSFQPKHALSMDVLPYFGSDHWPVFLEWKQILKKGPKPFHFEKLWLYPLNSNRKWDLVEGAGEFIPNKDVSVLEKTQTCSPP